MFQKKVKNGGEIDAIISLIIQLSPMKIVWNGREDD